MSASRKRKINTESEADRKKRKGYFSRQTNNSVANLEPNISGIFISCPKHKERNCVRECYDLFNEYVEKLYEVENSSDPPNEGSTEDVETAFLKELASMKKKHGEYMFSSIQTGTDCSVFLKTNPPVDPVQLVHYILTDINKTKQKKTRFTQRLTPITKTCFANIPAIVELAKEVLGPHFGCKGEVSPRKIAYSVMPRIRNNSKIERLELIDTIVGIVGKQHPVNLDNPELVIIVEVFKSICGISVVQDYYKLKKYNLETITVDETDANQETTKARNQKDEEVGIRNIRAGEQKKVGESQDEESIAGKDIEEDKEDPENKKFEGVNPIENEND
ncbi:hypothetical protein G9A89_002092 [Geosiphon pyriformis]|nr:hypothetical protein G9A89_002092 [Geosiphon pyriformis]